MENILEIDVWKTMTLSRFTYIYSTGFRAVYTFSIYLNMCLASRLGGQPYSIRFVQNLYQFDNNINQTHHLKQLHPRKVSVVFCCFYLLRSRVLILNNHNDIRKKIQHLPE